MSLCGVSVYCSITFMRSTLGRIRHSLGSITYFGQDDKALGFAQSSTGRGSEGNISLTTWHRASPTSVILRKQQSSALAIWVIFFFLFLFPIGTFICFQSDDCLYLGTQRELRSLWCLPLPNCKGGKTVGQRQSPDSWGTHYLANVSLLEGTNII